MSYDPDALDRRDPALIARVLPLARAFATRYLRCQWRGAEHIPDRPALFVANHNGGIAGPDLACTLALLWSVRGPTAPLYALAHDFAMKQLRPLGRVLQRLGAVAASRRNAARVLDGGGQLLVYPGGDLDAYRATRCRDRVVILPRTGFVEVAADHGVPIVPVVAHGAHRSAWIVSEGRAIARALAMPRWARLERFPIALALPWGIAPGPWLPYLPLPFPVRITVLPAMSVDRTRPPCVVAAEVQATMQRALDALATR